MALVKGTNAYVNVAEADGALGRCLQGRDRAHERRLAGPVGPEQAKQAWLDLKADIVQRNHATTINLRDAINDQHALSP